MQTPKAAKTTEGSTEKNEKKTPQQFPKMPTKLPPVNGNHTVRNTIIIVAIVAVFSALFFLLPSYIQTGNNVSLSKLLADAKGNKVTSMEVSSDNTTVTGKLKGGVYEYAYINPSVSINDILNQNSIKYDTTGTLALSFDKASSFDINSFATILITILVAIALFMFFRQMRQAGGGLFSMGESKAKLFVGKKQDITFASVAGVNEAKQELEEVVQFLKTPKKFTSLGARIPRGLLLVGAPGTGKTLLAKAIAGEAGVAFFSCSGSEFEEMLVGAGAARVRDLFSKARKASPCIVFIDEIDAVGRRRGTVLNSGHTEQTLNQILVEMDGFDSTTNVIVIGATNRPDVLDPALLRPGRFDRTVMLDIPDLAGRKQILAIHAKNKPLAPSVSMDTIAKRTVGFSGADIENMLNEAAIITAKEDKKQIDEATLEEAATKVVMGPAKRGRIIPELEKKTIAYHEAGHAVVSKFVPDSDPVHRITIIARGMSGGSTMYLPENESGLSTRAKLLTTIIHMMGGYAAEKLIFGDVTNGASDDIKKATRLAKKMVTSYGMSDSLGPVLYGNMEDFDMNLGGYGETEKSYSEQTSYKIDQEVQQILSNAYKTATDILIKARGKLDRVVEVLLKEETIEGADFDKLMSE